MDEITYPDPFVQNLIIEPEQTWTRELLWSYHMVEKITIKGDWDYEDDDCSNFCKGLPFLKEFEVIDSEGTFFTEDGILYANKMKNSSSWGRFYGIPENLEGKVLVAIPSQYSKKEFCVAEGTVAICIGVFNEMNNIESITFPDSIEYLGYHCIDHMSHLKELYIPNKPVEIADHYFLGTMPKLKNINSGENLDEMVRKSWLLWWLWK